MRSFKTLVPWYGWAKLIAARSDSNGRVAGLRLPNAIQQLGLTDPTWRIKSIGVQRETTHIIVEPVARSKVEGYLDPLPKSHGGWLIAMHCVYPSDRRETVYSRVDREGNFSASLQPDSVYCCMIEDREECTNCWFGFPCRSDAESNPTIALRRVEPNIVDVLITKGNERIPWAEYSVDAEVLIPFNWIARGTEEDAGEEKGTEFIWRRRVKTDPHGRASIRVPFDACDVTVFEEASRKFLRSEFKLGETGPIEFHLDDTEGN